MYVAALNNEFWDGFKESIEAFFQRMLQRCERGRFEEVSGGTGENLIEARRARAARLASLTYEDILETKVIVGSPERVIDRLTQFKEMLGLTGFTAELKPGGLLPKEAVHRSLKLLTQEVMPPFK
jgi:alkanesulfonate monooxygenase SsuD/methylene tetrahydromethanopterin reductase-like flavin-dependent oxidoreductase (luciferase family)